MAGNINNIEFSVDKAMSKDVIDGVTINIFEKKLQQGLNAWLDKEKIKYETVQRNYSVEFKVFTENDYEKIYKEYINKMPYMTNEEIENKYAGLYVLVVDERLDSEGFVKGGNVMLASPFRKLLDRYIEEYEIKPYIRNQYYCRRKDEPQPIYMGIAGTGYKFCERDKNFVHIYKDYSIHLHDKSVIKSFIEYLIDNNINYNENFRGIGKEFNFENKDIVLALRRKCLNKLSYISIQEIDKQYSKKYCCIGDVRFKEGQEFEADTNFFGNHQLEVLKDNRVGGGTVLFVSDSLKGVSDFIYEYALEGVYVHHASEEYYSNDLSGVEIGDNYKKIFEKN